MIILPARRRALSLACVFFALAPALARPAEIDDVFRAYAKRLPAPVSLNDGNGVGPLCPNHRGGNTFNWLATLARSLPVKSPADLPRLVPWARNADVCLRVVALGGLMDRTGFDGARFNSGMFDPDSWMGLEILSAARDYFDAHAIPYDPALFAGPAFAAKEKEFAGRIAGTWEQDVDRKYFNFVDFLSVKDGNLLLTTKKTAADPRWPDRLWSRKIAGVRLNARHQYALSGAWDAEPAAVGANGKVVERYDVRVWFVSPDALWFKRSDSPSDWTKFTRVR